MHYGLPYKTKQFFTLLIKLSIVVGAGYFIVTKLTAQSDLYFSDFLKTIIQNGILNFENLLILLGLSLLNWSLEIYKWKALVSFETPISWQKSAQQSLAGLTASFITPNRLGDYGAKLAYFNASIRKRIALLNLLGHMAQMTATTVLGLIGFIYMILKFNIDISSYKLLRGVVILATVGALSVFGLRQNKFRIKGFSLSRILNYIKHEMPFTLHLKTLGLSALRYFCFSFQLYFILMLFGASLTPFEGFIAITSLYFLASIVPTLAIFDVVIKSGSAIYILSFFDISSWLVLSAMTLMYLLNFVLPGLFGSYFVLNFKLPKQDT
ncbi:hypothetical protein Q2T40_16600 [Winogradskyella maritima]|uniref:Lysylphosphatidylglycerol synthase-like protein n=1 Tax=Winogradskyella maritima TaxID=1517766 RepID=A0ABV8AIT0_9FLAO|nr:hypothetical protein [Winogradskyella maritima]